MTNPMQAIHNIETGEVVEVELTTEQLALILEEKAKREAEKLKTEIDKAALFSRLGITAEEAALLLS